MVIKILAVNKSLTDRRTVYFSHKISLEIVSAIKDADSVSTSLLMHFVSCCKMADTSKFQDHYFQEKEKDKVNCFFPFHWEIQSFPSSCQHTFFVSHWPK